MGRGMPGAALVAALMLVMLQTATAHAAPPDGRAYELVSPPDKNGYPAFFYPGSAIGITRASDDGNGLLFYSFGSFAGADSGLPLAYEAKRGATGWASTPYSIAPVSAHPNLLSQTLPVDASPDLRVGFFATEDGIDPGDQNGLNDVYVRRADGRFEWISQGANGAVATSKAEFVAGSTDGEHVVFTTRSHMVPEDAGRLDSLEVYERSGGRTSLVNVDDNGALINACGSTLGAFDNHDNAISDDGSRLFFTTPNLTDAQNFDGSCFAPAQLYLRADASRTVNVSASRRAVPDPAGTQGVVYQGAATDGSKVFFSSPEMLTDDASTGGGLYEYDVDADELTMIGAAPGGSQLQGVARVSDDGSHVYFVARAAIDGQGTDGEDNLFLSSDGEIKLVVSAAAGSMNFPPLYGGYAIVRDIEITPDGRSVLFYSRQNLTAYDAAGFSQLYFFNEDNGHGIVCVSCNPSGKPPTTDAVRGPAFITTFSESEPRRSITADGSKVYFDSREQLVAEDRNAWRVDELSRPVNGMDVYEYDTASGKLALVSSGVSIASDNYLVDVAPSGRDVFFATKESLVPQDVDRGGQDIYDARLGGGFPVTPAPGPCEGDGCQAAPTPAPIGPEAGSIAFSGPEDESGPTRVVQSFKVAKITAAQRTRLAKTGAISLKVKVSKSGGVATTLRISRGGRWVAAGSAQRLATKAGTVTLTPRLSSAARRQLASKGRLSVRVDVRFSEARGTSTARFTLKKKASR
jgi:hypothetical protein